MCAANDEKYLSPTGIEPATPRFPSWRLRPLGHAAVREHHGRYHLFRPPGLI